MKKNIFIFFFLASLIQYLNAADQSPMRQAAIYQEAGMPDKAIEIYKNLLNGDLTKEQRDILQYNIATLYLQSGHVEEGIQLLTDIELNNVDTPLLTIRLNRNLAIAHYSLAKQPGKIALEVLYHLRLAEATLFQAAAAECTLQGLFDEHCQIPKDLSRLQKAVEADIVAIEAKASAESSLEKTKEGSALLQNPTPQHLLEDIVQREKAALLINSQNLSQKVGESLQEIASGPERSQQDLLDSAERFRKVVFKHQTDQFQTEGACQSSPWGAVFPLFEQGENFARQGLYSLEKTPINLIQAIIAQKKAYDEWKKALDAMINPKDDGQSGCPRGQSKSMENAQQGKAPQSQVEQTVLEMFLDDQLTKKTLPAIKLGERPW